MLDTARSLGYNPQYSTPVTSRLPQVLQAHEDNVTAKEVQQLRSCGCAGKADKELVRVRSQQSPHERKQDLSYAMAPKPDITLHCSLRALTRLKSLHLLRNLYTASPIEAQYRRQRNSHGTILLSVRYS